MKYITENSAERIQELADYLPDYSSLVKLDNRILAVNVKSASLESEHCLHSVRLTLDMVRDPDGRISVVIDRHIVARELYNIAEPDGVAWMWLSDKKKAKYIRMQDAGVTP